MADSNPADGIKRYTPPVHRNRANNRRKAGDRAEKPNYSYNIDGEKSNVPSLKNLPPIIHHDAFVSNAQSDHSHARLVPLEGCSASEAAQLHSDRWAAAMSLYNDPNVSSDKPVIYAGSGGSSWGHAQMKLPHQMNFLEDLRRAVDAQRAWHQRWTTPGIDQRCIGVPQICQKQSYLPFRRVSTSVSSSMYGMYNKL